MNNTPTRSDEVDGAFLIHHNVRQKVPDTRRGDKPRPMWLQA